MALAPAQDAFAQSLARHLPADTLRPAEPRYLEEPRGKWHGNAAWVALPRCTDDVATIIRACATARVGVIPYGGGTGLVAGQVKPDGPLPLILSLERMNKVLGVYPEENTLIAQAGAILADVQAAAADRNRLFPLSLASEGSARIGGLLGTNAGGVNVLRYGNARDLCLGLEAVLPDGQVHHGLKRLRKDNTGYDLRNLLIGAEGTLGVITAATLKLSPVPAAQGTAFLVVNDPAAALSLLSLARDHIGDGISAFELISGVGLDFLAEKLPDLRRPFPENPRWMVLIDLGLSLGQDPHTALENLFEAALAAGLVSDGLIAQSEAQRQDFWRVREDIPTANRMVGAIASHDISLPLGAVADFIATARERLKPLGPLRINCFGHLGDGNLHFNLFPPKGTARTAFLHLAEDGSRILHELVHATGGSISAEHGIGRLKASDLERYGDPAKLWAMRTIKTALDPLGIMNPGAVLRQTATT
ncbi:FAD-binding oxidoreductase [Mesobacterium sp. TK19101]|uniref:FAD-binding oxidoreductase n=1 Tax=Mesobacterium hydrothermale TaxID=3111907 RepID=A0ABU6HJJ7_9RHOB|nr:FAD-binding oxidoreductase [Mesobacterium sp. TK19101]MEC3862015.1 FAD-binding oxidoreductase [Mesobacterium sp. TK19101]